MKSNYNVYTHPTLHSVHILQNIWIHRFYTSLIHTLWTPFYEHEFTPWIHSVYISSKWNYLQKQIGSSTRLFSRSRMSPFPHQTQGGTWRMSRNWLPSGLDEKSCKTPHDSSPNPFFDGCACSTEPYYILNTSSFYVSFCCNNYNYRQQNFSPTSLSGGLTTFFAAQIIGENSATEISWLYPSAVGIQLSITHTVSCLKFRGKIAKVHGNASSRTH